MTANLMPILGTLIIAMLGWLITEQRTMRSDIGDLHERMARLEGRMDTLESVIVQVFTKRGSTVPSGD